MTAIIAKKASMHAEREREREREREQSPVWKKRGTNQRP